jgi:mono/diheme cytochrome c family protein
MKNLWPLFGIILFVEILGGCGTANTGEQTVSISGSSTTPATDAGNTGSNTNTTTTGPTSTSVFALADAKPFCVACHVSGGSGAGVWAKADGTEADWKTFASTAKASVQAGSMPPAAMSADSKTKFVAYLDSLLATTTTTTTTTSTTTNSGGTTTNSGGGGSSGTLVYTITEAAPLCSGCHTATSTGTKKPLVTLADWNNRTYRSRMTLYNEVNSGGMPKGSTLTSSQKTALLAFILTLNN